MPDKNKCSHKLAIPGYRPGRLHETEWEQRDGMGRKLKIPCQAGCFVSEPGAKTGKMGRNGKNWDGIRTILFHIIGIEGLLQSSWNTPVPTLFPSPVTPCQFARRPKNNVMRTQVQLHACHTNPGRLIAKIATGTKTRKHAPTPAVWRK